MSEKKFPKASSITKKNILGAIKFLNETQPVGAEYQQDRIEQFGILQRENIVSLGATERLIIDGNSSAVIPQQPRVEVSLPVKSVGKLRIQRGRRWHPTTRKVAA